MTKTPKRPRDVSLLAKMMVDIASGENGDVAGDFPSKGRAGGLKGGPARAAKLSPSERSASAKKAAVKRWRG